MNIKDYIIVLMGNLVESGYKNVQLVSTINVTLSKNCVSEDFLAVETSLDANCFEVFTHNIEEGVKVPGSKIKISGVPKGKRKSREIVYYVGIKN